MDIFTYKSYKQFLIARLKRGEQKKLAQHLGCQAAFLSQVLNAEPNLSLEQGVRVQSYFQLSQEESEYFMTLLHYERAGSHELKTYYSHQLKELKSQRAAVSSRIKRPKALPSQVKETYYSSWRYSWVHVLTSIQTKEQMLLIQKHTGLSKTAIEEVLNFLEQHKLIQKKNGQWVPTTKKIHVASHEPQSEFHHRNFHIKTIQQLERKTPVDLHFSSVLALSYEDAEKIRDLILEFIQNTENILAPSEEQTARVLMLSYYEP